jgi:hypothetical protein
MKEIKDIKHLVVVGAWNIAIFSPEWMQKYILTEYPEVKVEFPLHVNSSLRFTTGDFVLAIINGRLEIMIKNNPAHTISCLRFILQKLIHTPVSAFGVNFIFSANKSELPEGLWAKFFVENPFSEFPIGYELIENTNAVLFKVSEMKNLRLGITKKEDETVIFEFNFDHQIKSAEDLLTILGDNDSFVTDYHDQTLNWLSEVYKLNLD